RVAVGTVSKVAFEPYDGDVHVDLRLDGGYETLLSDGNDRVGGNLVVEVIPFDRSRVAVPAEGARVEVVGPWVEDDQHGWNEIHPAWWISVGRIEPAADESDGTIKKRFDSIDVESTEDNRRAYRELLFATEGAEDYISGVILFDE